MRIIKSKTISAVTFFTLLFGSVGHANENMDHKQSNWDLDKGSQINDHHALVHPFVAHMGMPESPGELNARISTVEERSDGSSQGTYAFHFETGIVDRLGLHLRNDAVKFKKNTELMLQYAVIRSGSGANGISLIGELEFPTGPTEETTAGGFGISFAYILLPALSVNSVVHYFPRDKMTEWEIAFVSKLNEKIFPVLEASGEKMKDEDGIVNALAGLKFKIPNGHALGVAYQVGTTGTRDYDSRLLLQADLSFH